MVGRAIRRAGALLASAAMLAAIAGCSVLSGSSNSSQLVPERGTLRIGVLPAVDVAPLYIAQRDKLFDAAGLQVELISQASETDAIHQLQAGTIDMVLASYVTLFKSAASGVALQLQGEAYQAGRNTMALVTSPTNTKYRNLSELSAPKIAVNSLDAGGDIGVLTSKAVLQVAGVDPNAIKFSAVKYADMATALQNNTVDAAWMVEPYITAAQRQFGAQILTDAARGATLDFPVSGYAAARKFADDNPKTMAVFRKVLASAQQRAADPLVVHSVLSSYAGVDSATADLVSVGNYPVSVNPVRLQRVADMMETMGLLSSHFDVQQLVPRPTP